MAVTRITGAKWIKKDTVTGGTAAGEGQIASSTIDTYNLAADAVDATILDETGDYTVNKLIATVDVQAVDITASGEVKGLTVASGTNGTEFTVDASGNVVIAGDLTVNGDNIIANTTTLDVEDKNITIAKGGTVSTANGAGITVDITDGTAGSIVYKSSSATKFAIGDLGTEDDMVGATAVQTLTNKTVDFVNGDSAGATELTIGGTAYQDLESALVALNSAVGGEAQVLYTDDSALSGSDLTVAGSSSISAVYVSGIRMSLGADNDYTVDTSGSDAVITFADAPSNGMNIVVDYK